MKLSIVHRSTTDASFVPIKRSGEISRNRKRVSGFLMILSFCFIFAVIGCNRQYYRQKADTDVYHLINTAPKDERWELTDYTIQAKPESRFYDPFDPDCEPMPPDDVKAHQKMRTVYGMETEEWDVNHPHTPHVENPYWQQYLTLNDHGELVLDRKGAFQLAQIHSSEFQTALENLYMSALDVSFQRFQFDTQFDALSSLIYGTSGANKNSRWTAENGLNLNKMSVSGGEYMIGIANSLTWTLAGPKESGPGTVISMSILQPLLREGGRAIVLEELTKAERNLLANIRQMAFYRQGFYNTVVAGGRSVGMPTASGTPTGNSTGISRSGGYISLLAQQIQIQNQRSDVVSQQETQIQLLELFQADRLNDRLQVEQAKSGYLRSLNQLLEQQTDYDTSVDQFLVATVGLPPDLKVKVEDPLVDQFELMSPQLSLLQGEIADLLQEVRNDERPIPENALDRLIKISTAVRAEIVTIRGEIEKLDKAVPERIQNLKFLQERLVAIGREGDKDAYSVDEFVKRVERVHTWMPYYEKNLQVIDDLLHHVSKQDKDIIANLLHQGKIDPKSVPLLQHLELSSLLEETRKIQEAAPGGENPLESERLTDPYIREAQKDPYRHYLIRIANRLLQEVRFLSVNQARARLDTITIIPIDITPETSLKIAALNRLDWMNERTRLVNSWRNIEVAANKLRGYLNLKFNGEIGTPHDKPLEFQSSRSSLSVGAEFKAPLTRLAERNEYRTALIEYQRARRNYYRYVDEVHSGLREKLRRIQTAQLDFEVQRESVNVAVSKVILAQMNLEKPQPVGQVRTKMNNTLARDLTEALSSLLDDQNALMNLWVNYYCLRLSLCLDLGLIQLDEDGMWLDPGSMRESDYIRFTQPENSPEYPDGNPPETVADISGLNPVFPQELAEPESVNLVEQANPNENTVARNVPVTSVSPVQPVPPRKTPPEAEDSAVSDSTPLIPSQNDRRHSENTRKPTDRSTVTKRSEQVPLALSPSGRARSRSNVSQAGFAVSNPDLQTDSEPE
ncbi:MAG: hypothetical protein LBQ54_00060 [Planctomycetaceae bacterium]|jgi:hypothetical protein|nr:hypothetical protein [Planctomycetaceae bacterium]